MCRARRVQQGETTQWSTAHKEEQRRWARWARCNRVHSAVTQEVKAIGVEKMSFHAVYERFASGQLLFLGLKLDVDFRRGNGLVALHFHQLVNQISLEFVFYFFQRFVFGLCVLHRALRCAVV